jgi:hypothetical protein
MGYFYEKNTELEQILSKQFEAVVWMWMVIPTPHININYVCLPFCTYKKVTVSFVEITESGFFALIF